MSIVRSVRFPEGLIADLLAEAKIKGMSLNSLIVWKLQPPAPYVERTISVAEMREEFPDNLGNHGPKARDKRPSAAANSPAVTASKPGEVRALAPALHFPKAAPGSRLKGAKK